MITQKVSKASGRESLLKIRRLVVAIVLFLCAQWALYADGYYTAYVWTDAGADHNWTTPGNWKKVNVSWIDEPYSKTETLVAESASDYPNSSDAYVYIRGSTEITLDADVTVKGISLGSNEQSSTFEVSISGDYTLTVSGSTNNDRFAENGADVGIVTYRPTQTADTSVLSSLTLNCNVVANNFAIHSGGDVTINDGRIARIKNVTNMAGSANTPTTITVDGFLAAETITLADFNNQKLSIPSTGFVSAQTVNKNNGTIDGTVYTQTDFTENVWLGRIDASWTNPFNWSLGKVPEETDKLRIPASPAPTNPLVITTAITISDTANLTVEDSANITIDSTGSLTLTTGAFDIRKIKNTSEGTLIFSGDFSHLTDEYRAPGLVIQCGGNLEVSKNLQCKSISVTGTAALNNASSSDQTWLVAAGDDGINFGNTVTVDASGAQFVLGGNVSSTGTVNINITSGMLNHVEETTGYRKTWGSNLTAVLSADNCSFGMAEGSSSSYKASVTAPADSNVYFVGSGKFSSLEKTNSSCVTHFGNSGDYTNTFTFDSNVSSLGKIVFDSSCAGLNSVDPATPITLSGITVLDNQSTRLTSALGVNLAFENGAGISGNPLKVKDITFDGTATFDDTTDLEVAGALSATGAIAFGGSFTNATSASSTFTNGLTVAGNFSDSGTSFSGRVTLNSATGDQSFSGKGETSTYAVEINKTSGNVTFPNALTLSSLTTNAEYAGEIIFSGEGNQSFTAQSGVYKKITVSKDAGTTLTVSGDLQAEAFAQTTGDVQFNNGVQADSYVQTSGNVQFDDNVQFGSYVQISGNVQFNGDVQSDSYTHTAGSIEFKGDASITTVSFNNTTENPVTFTGGTAVAPHSISGSTLTLTNLSGDYVTVGATTTLQINGANVSGLGITSSTPTVKMQGTITTTGGEDFVIDYPLVLSDETVLNIADDLIICDIGSIKSAASAGNNLTITANTITIEDGNPLGENGVGKLGTITINSHLELSANTPFYCDKTIFAGTGNKTLSGENKLTHVGNIEIPTGKNWTFNNQFDITGNLDNNGTASFVKSVTITGNLENSSTADFDESVSVTGDLINSGTATFDKAVSVTGSFTNNTSSTFTNGLSLTGDFVDSGTTFSGAVTLNGSATAQSFTGTTLASSYSVSIDKTSGDVTFPNALTLTALNQNDGYTGTIIFSGTGNQTFTPQAFAAQTDVYNSIKVNKSSDILTVSGDLHVKTLTHTDGAITFAGNVTLWDGNTSSPTYSDASFTTTDEINFTDGATDSPRTLKAKSITAAGSIVCSDGTAAETRNSYLKLETTDGNINISGNIGSKTDSEEHYYNKVTLDSGEKDIVVGGKIYTSDISVACKNVEFTDSIYTGNVGITATDTLIIKNGLEAATLTINPGAQKIKMGGLIKLTDDTQDFIIDYPLLLTANTTFQIAGNIKIKNSASKVGSINSETDTACSLSLQTTGSGKKILIQNLTSEGAGLGTTKSLSTITINSSLDLTANTTFKTSDEDGTIFAGTSSCTTSGSGKLTLTGNMQNTGNWTYGTQLAITGTLINNGTAEFNNQVAVTGNITNNNGKNITFNDDVSATGNVIDNGTWTHLPGKKLTFNGTGAQSFTVNASSSYADVVVDKESGTFALSAKLKAANFTGEKAITFNGDIEIETTGDVIFKKPVTSTTNLSIKADELKFQDEANVNNITMEATATTSSDITVTGNWTNNKASGGFTADAGTVTFAPAPASASVSVRGNNIFKHFTAANLGEKTIAFEAGKTQTVNGTLTLSGSSDTSLLRLENEGTGVWTLDCTNPTISCVDVIYSTSTNSIFATSSKDRGHNTNWNFPGEDYEWTGADSTNPTRWDVAANWNPASVPGIGADVTIPEISSNPASYPKLIAPLDITNATYSGTITVAANAQFDLADKDLTVGTITNNGLVRLFGTQTITATMNNGSGSIVEYYDSDPDAILTSFVWDGDSEDGKKYENLVIKKKVTQPTTSGEQIKVSGTTTISAGAGNNVSLNNASNVFTGTIKVGDTNPSDTVNAGAVTLNAGSAITIANNANATSLTLNCAATVSNITTTSNQTYNGQTTLADNATLTASSGSITFGTSATIDGTKQLTLSSTGTTFGANVGYTTPLASLEVTGPLAVNCGTINTSGDQTYKGAVTLGSESNITSTAGDISIESTGSLVVNADSTFTVSTAGKKIDFSGAITGTAKLTTAGSGTAHFNNSVNTASLETQAVNINTTTITTTGAQQYNGKVILEADAVTITATSASITFGTSATIDGTKQLTLSSTTGTTFGANVGNTTTLASLEVSGPVTVNCGVIKTSGTQTYNGTVQIDTAATVTSSTDSLIFKDDITITENVTLAASTSGKEIDFAKGISGSGKTLTVNTPAFKRIATTGNTSSIALAELVFSQDTSIQSQNTRPISLTVPKISGIGKTVTLAASVSELSFSGNVEFNPNITTTENSHFKASSDTMTFKADVNFADNTLAANNGTIILTAQNKTSGAAAILSGNNSFNNLTLQGPVAINGSNSIANLTAGTTTEGEGLGGKTITFGAGTEQTISGKLTLRGTAKTDGNRLNLRSSTPGVTANPWKINCTGANSHDIEYVDVQDSNNITSSYYLFALNSIDHGNNTKWNFPGMQYKWTGADSTDPTNWNVAANWKYLSIPGKGADIEIPADCAKYPKLIADLDLNDSYGTPPVAYKGKITIAANAQFDLSGKKLTLDEIINNGLVRLTGTSGQTISGKMTNGTGSTVEYYDTGAATTNFAWDGDGVENGNSADGKQYANLILNQAINQSTDATNKLDVSGITTIIAGSTNSVTLDNEHNIFGGHLTLGNQSTSTSAGTVTLNGTGTAGVAIFLEENVLAQNLTLNSNVQGADLTITAPLTINCANVTTTGNQTYKNPVTISHDVNFTADSGKLIKFEKTVTGSGAETLTTTTGNSQFDDEVSGLTSFTTAATVTLNANVTAGLVSTQSANLNCTEITTTGTQTYGPVVLGNTNMLTLSADSISFGNSIDGAHSITLLVPADQAKTISVAGKIGENGSPSITIAQAGKVTFSETVKINDFTLTKANSTSFEKAVDIASFTDITTEHTGSVAFAAGGIIRNDVTFNTNNLVSFTGTMNIGAEASRKDLTHTEGNTTINGTLNAADVTLADTTFTGTMNASNVQMAVTSTSGKINATTTQLGNLTLTGDTKITTTGTQLYNGTINDSAAGEHILTLASGTSQITFLSDVGQTATLKVLTVNGPIAVNCSKVKTTASQNYNAAVTSTGSIEFQSAAINLKCATVITDGSQTYDGPVILLSDTKVKSDTGNIHLTSSLTGAYKYTIEKTNDATFDGAVDVTSFIITEANDTLFKQAVTTTDFKIIQANDTQFNQSVTTTNFDITQANDTSFDEAVSASNKFEITQANDTQFDSTLTTATFKITQAANTTFDGAVTIASFIDATTAGNISFNAGGTISNAAGTTFNTNDLVTFGDNQADTMTFGSASSYADLKHILGGTSITGMLKAANITLAQTTGGQMIIENSGLLTTTDGSSLTYGTSFAQNGTGNSKLGGSFGGAGSATFATNVQLYGTSAADFGAAGTNISIGKNLIIIRDTTDDLDILSNASATENIVLYKGPVTASANVTVGKDILILGDDYSTTDTTTGITDEYAYNSFRSQTDEWSQPNYTETVLPDGAAVQDNLAGPSTPSTGSGTPGTPDFSSSLSVASGKTITAGKNFYANGTTLQTAGGSGQWELKLPDLTNPTNGFAEAYHSHISGCKVICSDGTSNGTKARLVALECTDDGDNAASVDFDEFEITAAYTERDNAIRVEFNRPVRFNSYTIDLLKFHDSSDAVSASTNFTGFYTDPDCQNQISIGANFPSYTNGGNTYYYLYIKAAPQDSTALGAWNTDATGKSSGAADGHSTDRNGVHHTALPCLDFPRALQATASGQTTTVPFILTDIWGKRLNNYSRRVTSGTSADAAYGSTADSTNDVLDKTGPVLWKVRTGQELHSAYDYTVGESCEHSYDAHNFIEFRYSEKVDFDGDETTNAALNADPTTAENVQVTDSFGALKNNDITTAGALSIAGLGIIQNGLIHTGRNGSANKYVNSLYRKDAYSINLSIAGYTDGTVTDPDGYTYKKWIGYIEQAQMPTGTVTHLVDSTTRANTFVKDKDGNSQIQYPAADANTIPTVNSAEDGLYGAWDISEPVFAIIRQDKNKHLWAESLFASKAEYEAIGNTSGVGSTLDRIEFHVYDNTPEFGSDSPEWFSEIGWCAPGSDGTKNELYKPYSYSADIFGGARAFDADATRRTSGGVRYSTINSSAFTYGIGIKLPDNLITTEFDSTKPVFGGATSLVFTGASSPRRSAGDLEGLYFALPLKNNSLDITTSFTVKYDDSKGYITDLAGNRLRSKSISTIDRTPPSIDMTVAPVGSNQVEIIFVKELQTKIDEIKYLDNNTGAQIELTQNSTEELFPYCFDLIKINSSGVATVDSTLAVDVTVPARISVSTNANASSFTKIQLTLNRNITVDDIKTLSIRIKNPEQYGELSTDLFTAHKDSRVTFIQDQTGNNIQMYTAHALSDFAVGVINPLYAYDTSMTTDDGGIIADALIHKNLTDDVDTGSWAVHDWNRNQQNYGTLPWASPLAIVADTTDGTEANENAPANFRLYLANNPDAASVSTQFNKDLEPSTSWRIWFPAVLPGVFTSLSEANNTSFSIIDSQLLQTDNNSRLIFDIGKSVTDLWSAGNQISFLFGLTNSDGSPVTIQHSPELDINHESSYTTSYYLSTSLKSPLFAVRQTDPQDLLSLDLWSFRLKANIRQRGGVTILNNVIDASAAEKAVVCVEMPSKGRLDVLVMTLDGSIVDYLHRGIADSGTHYYSWDGTNLRGNPVARGMYFIRVTGEGLDETRKVMVVKE